MMNWIVENWELIAITFGIVIGLFLTVLLGQFILKYVGYLLNKRVLLVNKETYHQVVMTRDSIDASNGSLGIDQLNGLFESIAEVANHKDKLVRATGESLKKLDSKIDNMSATIAMLEEQNKQLRIRDEVLSKIKTIKLLLTTIEEIDKFIPSSQEKYLEFIKDNIESVLIGLGVEPFQLQFIKNEDYLKYYRIDSTNQDGDIALVKQGYLINLPEGDYVVKQAVITYEGV